MKTCPICKKDFEPTSGHNEQIFCSLPCCWESKKVESGYKKAVCIDCGSVEIFKHGVHNIAKRVCKGCFDERWKKLNHDKNFFKKKSICSICGTNSLAPNTKTKKNNDGEWICGSCRITSLSFCRCCGLIFGRGSQLAFCSDRCEETFNKWFIFNSKYFTKKLKRKRCVGCGVDLNEKTRSHKKADQQCNECNYITRRLRKDKAIYGGEHLDIIGQMRLIESIGIHFKKNYQGGALCHGNNLNWGKIVERLKSLFKLELLKTSLNLVSER